MWEGEQGKTMERVSGSKNNLPMAESRGEGKGKRKKKNMRLPKPILEDPLNHEKSWVTASPEGNAEPLKSKNLLKLTPKKDAHFITGAWNAKEGSQEIPGVTGKFGFGVQNEAGKILTEFCQESARVIANTLFQQDKR